MARDTSILLCDKNGHLVSKKEKNKLLIKALLIGEKSPRVENFDPKTHLKKLYDNKK
jgi:hypothetical protein